MDDNTFKLGLAVLATLQTIALAFLGWHSQRLSGRVDTVNEGVNGLAKAAITAATDAAAARGELAGRDFITEQTQPPPAL